MNLNTLTQLAVAAVDFSGPKIGAVIAAAKIIECAAIQNRAYVSDWATDGEDLHMVITHDGQGYEVHVKSKNRGDDTFDRTVYVHQQ